MAYQYQMPPMQQAPAMAYVGVGRRFLALLIDGIIIGAIVGIVEALLIRVSPALAGTLGSLIGIVYLFGLEATQGATLGKRLLGLRVVRMDGSPIGWSESIIRNLLRIVDGLFGYLVGAIIIWNSPLKQRLGDKLANTVVVSTR